MRPIHYKYIIFSFLFCILGGINLYAQHEAVIPIRKPSAPDQEVSVLKSTNQHDTLELPFIEDFARKVGYPTSSLWTDNLAYVNYQYPLNSISIGAATLDAIDEAGKIYGSDGENIFEADYLTSKPINLSYNPGDSIYLSFYYQPGGLGDTPEPKDSLILQFYNSSTNAWQTVWRISYSMEDSILVEDNLLKNRQTTHYTDSTGHSKFRQTILPVIQEEFLSKGFQFRFHNFASISSPAQIPSKSGNADHWHIDFIKLDANRNHNDTVINDIAFTKPMRSLLINYESVPWQHFPDANAFEMKDSLSVTYRNIGNQTWNISREFEIIDRMWNTPTYSFTGGTGDDVPPYTVETYPRNINYIFPFNDRDSALFEIKAYLITDTVSARAPYRWNDSISYLQKFYNYYAYDDGTAENGYGLRGEGSENGRVAVRYNTYKADTLQAVQIYFNQTLDSASSNYFKIYIWDDNGGLPGEILYTQDGYRPVYKDSVNKFHNYPLKQKLFIEGSFFIGYEKFTIDMLNVGFDVNRINNDKQFYNLAGSWIQSDAKGTIMMRPVFGKYIPYTLSNDPGSSIQKQTPPDLSIYPNPARDFISFSLSTGNLHNYSFAIYSLQGRLIKQGIQTRNPLNISDLQPGIYIIQLTDQTNQTKIQDKIIISR
jgi:hypothetical protein